MGFLFSLSHQVNIRPLKVSTPRINKTTTMSSSTTSPQGGNQVFVSFRGKDVRSTFISHLYNWLDEEGFSHFDDEEPEDAGKMIKDKIFPAIDCTRVAIVVLSENYPDSRWCLNELVKIVNCKKTRNLVVIPVFYHVDSADVTKSTSESKFGQAFDRLCKEEKNVQHKEKWREALGEIKKIAGFEKRNFRNDSDLLDAIVRSLRNKIWPTRSLHFAKEAIGADRLAADVIPLLKIGQEDVRMIGISGTDGIGKTMVAKAVCKGTIEKFERFIFLDEVGEAKRSDLRKLQKKILQNLLEGKGQIRHDSLHGNITQIKNNLHRKKILLVLDGVSNKEQMKYLGVEDRESIQESFHLGSRILITTRDRNLLKDPKVDDEYIVEGLNQDEAFELFRRHAFKSEEFQKSHEKLSRYLAHYAGGHPLALIKWGSFLNEKSKDDWQTYSKELLKNPDINFIEAVSGRIFKEYPFKVVGPYGGHRGTDTWKDRGYTDVRKIDVGFDSGAIKRISILYDRYGYECNLVTHGTEGGEKSTIKLEYPNEYLTSISGYTKKVSRGTILQSLTFHTNRGKHAPIGTNNGGSKFSFPYTGGKIVGFHGSCDGSHLESIGAFYEPIPHTYPGRDIGPYGGAAKKLWDLGRCNDIRGIVVRYGSFIHSIAFDFFDASGSKKSIRHGGPSGENTFEIKLKNADEYITAFSGHFATCDGRKLISSLTFRTNKRILGPIGRERGKPFSSPSEAVKITGFFGGSDGYLESIGAHVESYSNRLYPFKSVGLFGSSKESNWEDGNEHTNVREILVEIEPGDGKFIRSITFRYEKNGTMYLSKRHGGVKGNDINPIKIDGSNEYLTSMSGYYKYGGITSLMFGTNKRTLKTIGCEEGMHFSSPVTGGKIVGFYGRSVENLEAIGAYFEPLSHPHQIKSIGPFGGPGGSRWGPWQFGRGGEIEVMFDHGIRDIRLSFNGKSQQVLDWRGHRTRGKKPEVKRVTMNFSREYLTSISGYIQEQEDGDIIQSLTFHTNRKKHGPFGKEMGKFFWYPSTGSRIIGFYGTHGKTLNSIGVHAQPIPRLYPFETIEPFEGSGGTPWDDGVHTDVRGFRISFGDAIKAIGIAYDNNGSFVSGSEHGNGYDNKGSFILGLTPGNKAKNKYEEVLLDYPKERLLSMSVWVDNDRSTGQTIVHDLKIFTTKKTQTYGPFIKEPLAKRDELREFHIPSKKDGDRRIVGFFGRVGKHLNSIGARLEPLD